MSKMKEIFIDIDHEIFLTHMDFITFTDKIPDVLKYGKVNKFEFRKFPTSIEKIRSMCLSFGLMNHYILVDYDFYKNHKREIEIIMTFFNIVFVANLDGSYTIKSSKKFWNIIYDGIHYVDNFKNSIINMNNGDNIIYRKYLCNETHFIIEEYFEKNNDQYTFCVNNGSHIDSSNATNNPHDIIRKYVKWENAWDVIRECEDGNMRHINNYIPNEVYNFSKYFDPNR